MTSWIVLGALLVAAVAGLLFLLRSIRRWRPDEPTSAEGKQAQARLWSTRIHDQH